MATFAANVRKRRLELGLFPRLCGQASGMDRANWQRVERGRPITMITALRVAEALETTVGELLGEVPVK